MTRYLYVLILVLVSCCCISTLATAQDTAAHTVANGPDFAVTGFYYLFPGASSTVAFTAISDYKKWHSELRYNYEDVHTASFFVGRAFDFEKKLKLSLTPQIGIVVGRTNAIAPGLEAQLDYSIFGFYAESEYVFDFRGAENNYFYVWSELGISPFNSFRIGITAQRTKIYKTRFDLQRGPFASYSYRNIRPCFYYFNPASNHNFFIVALECTF